MQSLAERLGTVLIAQLVFGGVVYMNTPEGFSAIKWRLTAAGAAAGVFVFYGGFVHSFLVFLTGFTCLIAVIALLLLLSSHIVYAAILFLVCLVIIVAVLKLSMKEPRAT